LFYAISRPKQSRFHARMNRKSRIIFDSNSPVGFYKLMGTAGLKKSPVHAVMHGQSFNPSEPAQK
jgi:hypothetical protein